MASAAPIARRREDTIEVEAPGGMVASGDLLDIQIATAKRFPRDVTKATALALSLATQDEQSADECIYAVPRDGKVIEGPSARFAEIMAYAWGNLRIEARQLSEDEAFTRARGIALDLEQNTAVSYETRRSIVGKHGRYSLDMVATTANAAASIALRNAVLKVIPPAIWRPIYDACVQRVAGDQQTLPTKRDAMIQHFGKMNIHPDQVLARLGVKAIEDITLAHIVQLRGLANAIKQGETPIDSAFPPLSNGQGDLEAVLTNELKASPEQAAQAISVWTERKIPPAQRLVQARAAKTIDALLALLAQPPTGKPAAPESKPAETAPLRPATKQSAPPPQDEDEMAALSRDIFGDRSVSREAAAADPPPRQQETKPAPKPATKPTQPSFDPGSVTF